jgi:DNA-binding response OmpR family regulator
MNERNILLVEDSTSTQLIVQAILSRKYQLQVVGGLAQAENEMQKKDFSLLLLDVMLPDGDGFAFCQKLRNVPRFEDTPIIFLTSKTEVFHRVHGFAIGADDYITKPFDENEFLARVKSKLRRPQAPNFLWNGPLKVDVSQMRAYFCESETKEHEIHLTPIEFKILVSLLKCNGQTLTREELVVRVWGAAVQMPNHTVDSHVTSLRKKLGDIGPCIRAVVKQGYCYSNHEDAKMASGE